MNHTSRHLTRTLFALGALTVALPSAHADYFYGSQRHFVHSAIGPGDGHGTISLGGKAWSFEDGAALPMVDVSYARGVSNRFDIEARLSTVGVLSFLDAGLRYRVAGDEDLSLGVKAGATAIGVILPLDDNQAGIAGGLSPGVVLSGGSRDVQLSVGIEAPIYLGAASIRGETATGVLGTLRPSVALEIALGNSSALYLQGQYWLALGEGGRPEPIGPMVGVGLSF